MAEKHRKRTRKLSLTLYDQEFDILEQKAFDANTNKTDFIRKILLYGSASERSNFSKEDTKQICYELNRIGNNINQLAYQANVRGNVNKNDFEVLRNEFQNLLAAFDDFVRE